MLFGNFSRTIVSQVRKEFWPKILNPNIPRSIRLSAMAAGPIQKPEILPVHGRGLLATSAVVRPMPSVPSSFSPLILSSSKMSASEFDYTPKHPLTGQSARGLRGNVEKIDWMQHLSRSQYLHQGEADVQAFIFNSVYLQ